MHVIFCAAQFCGCWGSNGTSAFAPGQACLWFSQGCTHGCSACDPNATWPWDHSVCGSDAPPLVCDPEHRTLNRHAPCGSASDWTRHNPWRAPGSAPVMDSCGLAGGTPWGADVAEAGDYINTTIARHGDCGSKVLPKSDAHTVWKIGEEVSLQSTSSQPRGSCSVLIKPDPSVKRRWK